MNANKERRPPGKEAPKEAVRGFPDLSAGKSLGTSGPPINRPNSDSRRSVALERRRAEWRIEFRKKGIIDFESLRFGRVDRLDILAWFFPFTGERQD